MAMSLVQEERKMNPNPEKQQSNTEKMVLSYLKQKGKTTYNYLCKLAGDDIVDLANSGTMNDLENIEIRDHKDILLKLEGDESFVFGEIDPEKTEPDIAFTFRVKEGSIVLEKFVDKTKGIDVQDVQRVDDFYKVEKILIETFEKWIIKLLQTFKLV